MEAPPRLDLARTALFCDLDGTLTPIVARPELVGPDSDRRRLLAAVSRGLSGRLAVVSGRGLKDLDRILEGEVSAVAAVHGLIRRTAEGRVFAAEPGGEIARAAEACEAFAAETPGVMVEDKTIAVALHFRAAPEAGERCLAFARDLARELDLVVQAGDKVVELRPVGATKGDAVAAFMRETPFKGFMPIFLGDDLTDEAGFEAVRRLGGYGVIVGERRPTGAAYALPDVLHALAWLEGAEGAL